MPSGLVGKLVIRSRCLPATCPDAGAGFEQNRVVRALDVGGEAGDERQYVIPTGRADELKSPVAVIAFNAMKSIQPRSRPAGELRRVLEPQVRLTLPSRSSVPDAVEALGKERRRRNGRRNEDKCG